MISAAAEHVFTVVLVIVHVQIVYGKREGSIDFEITIRRKRK